MDDFLRDAWTAEESQAMVSAFNPPDGSNGCLATQISLHHQGSLPLPRALSMKTVEEDVWKSLQQESLALPSAGAQHLRQLALGEVTLEDFLLKSGIVRESRQSPCTSFQRNVGFPGAHKNDARSIRSCNETRPMGPNTLSLLMLPSSVHTMQQASPQGMISPVHTPAQKGDWMVNPYSKAFSQQQQDETEQILHGSAMDVESPLSPGHDESSADTSNILTAQFGTPAKPGRKRRAECPIEKVIQRRQRRMIKNRESAARSRARKQSYIVELEAEVYELKEQNMELLRMKEEESELGKKQMLAVMPSSFLQGDCALKRTHTGPW